MNTAPTVDALLTLVERSGLLSAGQLGAYRAGADDPVAVARELVRDHLLTPFQARHLLRGKFRGYFITEKYKVLDELGAGGGGRVLLCEHLKLQKLVALKLLSASWMKVPGTTERFLREARAAAAVDHPNIVRVSDVEDKPGTTPFMVMEFVDGTNFHQLIAEHGPLSPLRAAHYIRQAAGGLEAARAVGLVHRDIKPANLLLDRTGLVRLTDLGLARFQGNALRNQNLTQQFDRNSVLGTLDFIAPEQVDDSSAVDTRADIYSLGYTLYYLLTGKMPFGEGSSAQKLMWHQLRHPEPISSMRQDVPPELEKVFRRMTEKSPADRYQTPAEVAEALRPLVTEPVPPPPVKEMPKVHASEYLLGLSPTPTPDLLVTPPAPVAPPTPTATDTAALERPRAHAAPGLTQTRAAPPPKSGSHVLAAIPAPRSTEVTSGEGSEPPGSHQPVTGPAPAPLIRARWPYYVVGLAALLLVIGIGLVVSRLEDMHNTPDPRYTPTEDGRTVPPPPPSTTSAPNGTPTPIPQPKTDPGSGPPIKPTDPPKVVPPPADNFALTGAGSSFVAPMMKHWEREYKAQTGRALGYTSSGSKSGVRQLFEKRVAFACTDAYLTDADMAEARGVGGGAVHVPLVMGAVVAAYNLPEVKAPLRFSGEVLAAIYLGEIKKWDDPAIKQCNPGIPLPALDITVVHRSDGSGTTFIWTDYLSKVSPAWKKGPGANTAVAWPTGGDGEDKNEGVAAKVQGTHGAIGYVELSFARTKQLSVAEIRNEADEYVAPSPASVAAAALARLRESAFPGDLRFTLTNVSCKKGNGVYPICGVTWAVLFRTGKDRKETVEFLRWAVHDGQKDAPELHYAPLPADLVKRIDAVLDGVLKDGKPDP